MVYIHPFLNTLLVGILFAHNYILQGVVLMKLFFIKKKVLNWVLIILLALIFSFILLSIFK